MKVQFKQTRILDGVTYTKGTHEVPDALAAHWYLLALVANKVAKIVGTSAKRPAAPKAPVAPEIAPQPEPEVAPPVEEAAPVVEKKKGQKKPKKDQPPGQSE